jgi:hypothetical protein
MSCDHSINCITVIDCVPCSNLTVEVGDYASRETDLEVDESLSWRGPTADQSKSVIGHHVCGKIDRVDPTGMSRPFRHTGRSAPAPDSRRLCRLL